jgi:hypothetical protein
MLMLVGMGNPLGTQNPHEYEFGQNFIPVMDMDFLAGVFFLCGYGFGQVIPSGFLPIAISSPTWLAEGKDQDQVHEHAVLEKMSVRLMVWKQFRTCLCLQEVYKQTHTKEFY